MTTLASGAVTVPKAFIYRGKRFSIYQQYKVKKDAMWRYNELKRNGHTALMRVYHPLSGRNIYAVYTQFSIPKKKG